MGTLANSEDLQRLPGHLKNVLFIFNSDCGWKDGCGNVGCIDVKEAFLMPEWARGIPIPQTGSLIIPQEV